MARIARKPTAQERNRKTLERIRKKEIENVPTGGGGGGFTPVFCRAIQSGSGNCKPHNTSNSPQLLPFDTIDSQSGGFTIGGPPSGWTGPFDSVVFPPADGDYLVTLTTMAGFATFDSVWAFAKLDTFVGDYGGQTDWWINGVLDDGSYDNSSFGGFTQELYISVSIVVPMLASQGVWAYINGRGIPADGSLLPKMTALQVAHDPRIHSLLIQSIS